MWVSPTFTSNLDLDIGGEWTADETMPLHEIKIKPQSWEDIKEKFAIFYASKDDDGIMWCPVRSSCGKQIGVSFLVSAFVHEGV